MLLTLASFICLLLVELGGYSKSNDTLNQFDFFTADLTNITVPSGSDSTLATAIQSAKDSGDLADVYQVYLWNYCSSNSSSDGDLDHCSKRKTNFVFDPLDVWGITIANSTAATATASGDNALESTINSVKDNLSDYEDELLGESGKKALEAYRKVAKWMFIGYQVCGKMERCRGTNNTDRMVQVSFWTTLATLAVGLLAICSRWGSLLTWIIALVSSPSLLSKLIQSLTDPTQVSAVFTFASVLTSTILFSVLVTALNKVVDDYGISLSTTRSTMIVGWLAVVFSFGALFFWLCSVCCCSGRSNPHHKSNKGGLWNAEPKGQ